MYKYMFGTYTVDGISTPLPSLQASSGFIPVGFYISSLTAKYTV